MQCLHQRASPALTLGALVSRCQYVWFMEILWERDQNQEWTARHVRVAPLFQEGMLLPEGRLVERTDWENMEIELELERGSIGFRDFMLWANHDSSAPPSGFRLLCRYADNLARIHGLPIAPLQLDRTDGSTFELCQAAVLGRGHRSLVIQVDQGVDYVVKVGRQSSIMLEQQKHQIIDPRSCQHLRAMVPGLLGTVIGAGYGLWFIGLPGYCERGISATDLASFRQRETYMMQATDALCTLHRAGILHRNLKPDNLLIQAAGILVISDFDVSCKMPDGRARRDSCVGAAAFCVSCLDAESKPPFKIWDDWAPLGLTFTYLMGLYDLESCSKTAALRRLLQWPYTPEDGLTLALSPSAQA